MFAWLLVYRVCGFHVNDYALGWCFGVNQGFMVWSFDIPNDRMQSI
jgi:hypothetical protein